MRRHALILFGALLACGLGAPALAGHSQSRSREKALPKVDRLVERAHRSAIAAGGAFVLSRPGPAVFSTDYDYYASLQTDRGIIRVRLMPDLAPANVTSFMFLARLGMLDGLVLSPGADAFTGSAAGAAYQVMSEFTARAPHDRSGLLTVPDSGPASSFGLTVSAAPALDGRQTVIGEVVEGLDMVDAFSAPVVIEAVLIEVGIANAEDCMGDTADTRR